MRAPTTWKNRLLATAACLASIASIAQAQLQCGSPNTGGTYKAGDPMSLSIAASATEGPFVSQVDSMSATLICTVAGNTIASVDIPKANVTAPYTYTVPSVGNVTAPGGTDGACIGNKFYITYKGVYHDNGLFKVPHDFTAKCNDVTITPEPFYVPPTTIPTANTTTPISTILPTSTSTKTGGGSKSTTSTATSNSPIPSNKDKNESENKEGTSKTTIVIIVAIVAVVILALLAVGIMFHLRRQRKRRMESAIMPWSTQNNSQFAKMSSSMDGDPRSPASHHAAAIGGVAAAGAVGAGFNKPQPKVPQPSHGGYYGDDSYGAGGGGYGQQQQPGHGGGYYDGQDGYGQQQPQDDFYNPYYAQHSGGGGGYQGGAAGAAGAAAAAGGYGYRNDKQAYYAGSSQGGRTPYQESHDPYSSVSPPASSAGTAGVGGYYPPPPLVGSGAMSPPTPSSSNLNSAPNELSSTTLTNSSGTTGRAPQVILSDIGHTGGGDGDKGGIPMNEMPSK